MPALLLLIVRSLNPLVVPSTPFSVFDQYDALYEPLAVAYGDGICVEKGKSVDLGGRRIIKKKTLLPTLEG